MIQAQFWFWGDNSWGRGITYYVSERQGRIFIFFGFFIVLQRRVDLISFQYNAGKRRHKHACKKISCFPPTIQDVLRDTGSAHEKARVLCTFLSMQFIVGYSAVSINMCSIYCIIGRSATYVGKSEHERAGVVGAPSARGIEHLYDIFFHNRDGRCENRKARAFKHETLA